MSNQTLETLLQHRTIRKYSDKEIPKEIVDSIIEAGFRASTTGNMQVYSVVITQDAENKKKLWELHFKQNMVLEAPNGDDFLRRFPPLQHLVQTTQCRTRLRQFPFVYDGFNRCHSCIAKCCRGC